MSPLFRYIALAALVAILVTTFFLLGDAGPQNSKDFPPHSV
jgi:hypothetical protein